MGITVKLVGGDSKTKADFELAVGKTTLGRSLKELNCSDKKVSREHASIEVTKDGVVKLTATHVNPCFIHEPNNSEGQVLKKDEFRVLKNGDKFSLLPKTYIYKVVINDGSKPAAAASDSEQTEDEDNDEVESDENETSDDDFDPEEDKRRVASKKKGRKRKLESEEEEEEEEEEDDDEDSEGEEEEEEEDSDEDWDRRRSSSRGGSGRKKPSSKSSSSVRRNPSRSKTVRSYDEDSDDWDD